MKKTRRKRIRKPEQARWSRAQSEAYTKDILGAKPISGTFLHVVSRTSKYPKEELNEAIRSDVQSQGSEG